MVVPKTSTLDITTPPSRWVVLLSKILLVLLILFLLPDLVRAKPKKKNRALENLYNARIIHCETGDCGHLIIEESMNCVTKCVSEKCYSEVKFDVDPLEDGEVDVNRAMLFAQCVRNELLKERARGRTRQ
mmetsp:Transcript_20593/g.41086  ORF Transcript_20593/g.41086 Transcript_20593/m.41086 type:complete len:130 (+) Transcript_20593:178-567(+)